MRDRSAPEARGTKRQTRCRPAEAIGLLLLLLCAYLSASSIAPNYDIARAGATDAGARRLQPVLGRIKTAFALPDLDGVSHALEQQAGRVVLVHFFATWCEPCREELFSLTRLLERAGGVTVSVVGVNVAEPSTRVRSFLDVAPVNFPVLLDADRAVTKTLGVSILPTTFVLDRALAPRLFVEGDIDWTRADVLVSLEQIDAGGRN
jgi:peroxiredoxin